MERSLLQEDLVRARSLFCTLSPQTAEQSTISGNPDNSYHPSLRSSMSELSQDAAAYLISEEITKYSSVAKKKDETSQM